MGENQCNIDVATNQVETIQEDVPTYSSDWASSNNYIFGKTYGGLYKYNLFSGESSRHSSSYQNYDIHKMVMLDTTNIIMATKDGVCIFNTNTNMYKEILTSCNSRKYQLIEYNPDEKRIYFAKIDFKLIDPYTKEVTRTIVSTDLNGDDEQELVLE